MSYVFVNSNQTPEQRRFKYSVVRYFGKDVSWAIKLRDWRLSNIAKFFGYPDANTLLEALSEDSEDISTTTE